MGPDAASASIAYGPGRGDRFATYPNQYRALLEGVGGGKVTGQRSVDVAGADAAYVLTATVPGTDGKTVTVSSLGVRRGDDTWVLTARAFKGDKLDTAAVTKSFRLGAS